MEQNNRRPRKRVSKKVLRRRQLTALSVIAFLVLMLVILVAKGCSKTEEPSDKPKTTPTETTTTTLLSDISTTTETVTEAVTTVVTTTNPASLDVKLSKREMYLDIGEKDVSMIQAYPEGSGEENEVWKSKDESIASVDSLGYVTGVSAGETYIILTFDNNPGVEIEIKVSVADSGSSEVSSSASSSSTSAYSESVETTTNAIA